MPKVLAQGQTIECDSGGNLRRILQQNGIDLYNGDAKVINCRGIGSCGTCAVQIEGEVSPVNWREKARRSLPPHSPTSNLRLGVLQVKKCPIVIANGAKRNEAIAKTQRLLRFTSLRSQ